MQNACTWEGCNYVKYMYIRKMYVSMKNTCMSEGYNICKYEKDVFSVEVI